MLFVRRYNPLIHHRRSIRLKGYDYSKAGSYFVTICCQNRTCLFGYIKNHEMYLNDAGRMIEKWFLELPRKFPDIELGAYIVMPNHFHAIIINSGIGEVPVGADLRVRPENANCENTCPENANYEYIRPENNAAENIRPDNVRPESMDEYMIINPGEHIGSPLPRVVQWFKTMTTNEYIRGVRNLGWGRFDGRLWQRDYYEHIIRYEKSYIAISNYIINNPANWKYDK